jgi:hypothetical protein
LNNIGDFSDYFTIHLLPQGIEDPDPGAYQIIGVCLNVNLPSRLIWENPSSDLSLRSFPKLDNNVVPFGISLHSVVIVSGSWDAEICDFGFLLTDNRI